MNLFTVTRNRTISAFLILLSLDLTVWTASKNHSRKIKLIRCLEIKQMWAKIQKVSLLLISKKKTETQVNFVTALGWLIKLASKSKLTVPSLQATPYSNRLIQQHLEEAEKAIKLWVQPTLSERRLQPHKRINLVIFNHPLLMELVEVQL